MRLGTLGYVDQVFISVRTLIIAVRNRWHHTFIMVFFLAPGRSVTLRICPAGQSVPSLPRHSLGSGCSGVQSEEQKGRIEFGYASIDIDATEQLECFNLLTGSVASNPSDLSLRDESKDKALFKTSKAQNCYFALVIDLG